MTEKTIQSKRRRLKGEVVSDKMDKTVVVKVDRTVIHSKYLKRYTISKRYKAHDERNECLVGDEIRIVESRPFSKGKHWRVEEILLRAAQLDTSPLRAE